MRNLSKIAFLVCLAVIIYVCESRGGRGGGGGFRGGGYRGGSSRSSRSSSRSSSSRYGRMPSKYNARGWTSRTKTTAIRIGTIYIASRLQSHYYRRHSDSYDDYILELEICRNIVKYPPYNSTQKIYGWFLCPTAGYDEDQKYCCGDENKEYCCSYWKTGAGIRSAVFIALGLAVALGVLIYCCCKNPKLFEGVLEFIAIVLCCPCNMVRKWCRRSKARRRAARQRRREENYNQRHTSLPTDDVPGIEVETYEKEPVDSPPPPPAYNECISGGERFSIPDVNDSQVNVNFGPSEDNEQPPSYEVKPSAPPSPPRQRSSSPKFSGRSHSPDRHSHHSVSSNRS